MNVMGKAAWEKLQIYPICLLPKNVTALYFSTMLDVWTLFYFNFTKYILFINNNENIKLNKYQILFLKVLNQIIKSKLRKWEYFLSMGNFLRNIHLFLFYENYTNLIQTILISSKPNSLVWTYSASQVSSKCKSL